MTRIDERDTMFARMAYEIDGEEYKDYYKRNPDKKEVDDLIREKPELGCQGGRMYDELITPVTGAVFHFLSDIKDLSEGKSADNIIKIEDTKDFTEKLKSIAKFYGANIVGITKLEKEDYYSHRGRHKENYGEKIEGKDILPYAIIFAIEMDKEKIQKAPMVDEMLATTKGYMDTAITGMILAYYLRSLGYNARNHMDANYLLRLIPIAKRAGLGEIGRNGLLITKEYGPRVRLGVVTTDLKLCIDKAETFGVESFCEVCNICQRICPSRAIEKIEFDSKVKYKNNQEKCYSKWRDFGTDCGICISRCPFSRRKNILGDLKSFDDKEEYIKDILTKLKEEDLKKAMKK